MSWSTSKEKSHLLLPSQGGTPKATEASISQDDPVSRVKSGSTPSAAVKGGWYYGLEVYLFRILTETSMSVGWGRMLKDKRVRALVVLRNVARGALFNACELRCVVSHVCALCSLTRQQGFDGGVNSCSTVSELDPATKTHGSYESQGRPDYKGSKVHFLIIFSCVALCSASYFK